MVSIDAVAGVASVYGMPNDFAVRASITSAPGRPAPMPPVALIARGSLEREPRMGVVVSTSATFTSTLGRSFTRSNAARFSRSVTSSSAPPSKKSKIARGKRRFASTRRSSMLTALARFGTRGMQGRARLRQRAMAHARDPDARIPGGCCGLVGADMVRRDLRDRARQHSGPDAEDEPDPGRAPRAHDHHAPGMGAARHGERHKAKEAAKSLHNWRLTLAERHETRQQGEA